MVESKSFDYGVVCGSEHQLVVDAMAREPFLAALQTYGAAVLTPEEVSRFTERAFDPKTVHLRREFGDNQPDISPALQGWSSTNPPPACS